MQTGAKALAACAAALACAGLARAAGLTDNPIVGDAIQYLDGEGWTVSNGTITVGAQVPGDLITDLQVGGVIGDPLFELNFRTPVWDSSNWTYSTTFDLDGSMLGAKNIGLVFDGVKMAAYVSINGHAVGMTNDQFLRYVFYGTSYLQPRNNVLTVTFTTSADPNNNENRFMACTGGWDWAPYSTTGTTTGSPTFSKGIWKSVYLVAVSSAAIEHVVPLVFYNGSYPMAPLNNTNHGPFYVDVRVHFLAVTAAPGMLVVQGNWGSSVSQPVTVPVGESNITVRLSASAVALWWPLGMGLQTLYNVSVAFFPSAAGAPTLRDQRRVGFRVFTLVTGNDTDPSTLAGQDGSDTFTMRFKVNGANMYSRGGNMIPMEEMEGRANAAALRVLVESAAAANMNTFRLWGGGIFQYDAWYDACDELGIVIYHDMMYAQIGHSPQSTALQASELRHQVRRLASHPSIVIWDSCNECGGHGIYASFVATTVVAEDTSRPIWPSCPASGWTSGVDRLWSLPNGSPLGLQPRAPAPGAQLGSKIPAAVSSLEARRLRAAEAATAVSSSSSSSSSSTKGAATCTFVENADYDVGTQGPNYPATDENDCCTQCSNSASTCVAAVFASGTCWFKNQTQVGVPSFNLGRIACWPAGHGPIPPVPPAPVPTYTMETHGPYQHGSGFPAVNDPSGALQLFNPNVPPNLAPTYNMYGPSVPGTYASEFGGVAISSFESMAPTLQPAHWSVNSPPMAQRNYPVNNFILTYFNTSANQDLTKVGEAPFKQQLYLAQLAQGIEMKSDIEVRRSYNSFGSVTWQLNEIWPTGGWGSVEYGTPGFTAGQILGGRWKPLQYFLARATFRDQIAACGNDGRCYVKNDDALNAFTGTVTTTLVRVTTGELSVVNTTAVDLPRGAGSIAWFCLGGPATANPGSMCPPLSNTLAAAGCQSSGSDCLLLVTVTDASGAVVCDNFELLAVPATMTLPAAYPSFVIGTPNADNSVPITITTNAPALFVALTTQAMGRFSDNHFLVRPGSPVTVNFLPFIDDPQVGLLSSTLRIEHLQQHL